ncbi:hypothetical protein N7467_009982 [Penicillium canescens]|nr:hypothetical protein N7467_009982 [Penicillium canescens]
MAHLPSKSSLNKIVSHKVHDSVDTEHWRHHQKLQILGFIPLDDDACVYTKGQGKEMSSLIVHVDNFIIAAPSDAEVSDIVTRIEGFFFLPIKDLEEPSVSLGCSRSRNYDAGTITMRQAAYVLEILRKSMTGDTTGVKTLILASWKWPELEDAAEMLKEWNATLSIAFYSEMNNSQREELADEFIDPSSDLRVLISTYEVDTIGLNLHEACDGVEL